MTDSGNQHGQAAAPPRRACSWRALVIGALAVVLLAVWVPISDWQLGNTQLYNHYLPPVVLAVLIFLVGVVNPWLSQRYRLHRGELVVIAIMLLGLGGVVSGGIVRALPVIMTVPARLVATNPTYTPLQQQLPLEAVAKQREQVLATAAADVAAWDQDGESGLNADEMPGGHPVVVTADADGDGMVSPAELAEQRQRYQPDLVADKRWAIPPALTLGVPVAGPIPTSDPGYQQDVDYYLDGLPPLDERQAVAHRSRVTWLADGGQPITQIALRGTERDQARRWQRDFLDLDDQRFGARTLGLRAGDQVVRADGLSILIIEVTPPGVPLASWWRVFANWLPMLVAGLVAMVAVAGIVQRQWIERERLAYPVVEVLATLTEEAPNGQRWPQWLRDQRFWLGAGLAAGVLLWRGLFAFDVLPINLPLQIDLRPLLEVSPLTEMPELWWLAQPTLWLGFLAMTFFMRTDVSFSLWFFFVLSNVVAMASTSGGVPIGYDEILQATVGGFGAMCVVVVYLGRQYYWALCCAALGRPSNAEARAGARYVWLLLTGCATVIAGLMWHGAPFFGSLLLVLIILGLLLVIARIVAETGLPYVQSGELSRANPILLSLYGFGVSPLALMPLAFVGAALAADNRQSLLPYAVTAGALGERAGVKPARVSSLLMVSAVAGLVLAFVVMVVAGYRGNGGTEWWPAWFVEGKVLQPVANLAAANESPAMTEQLAAQRQGQWLGYGVGAGIVGGLGWARMTLAWWPLHPIGVVLMASACIKQLWGTLLLGWLAKVLVMRYGGTGLYQRLKPVALGLICGEALMIVGFALVRTIAAWAGSPLPEYNLLPW